MKITFIGGGNMATALIGGLLKGAVAAGDISVVEPDAQKCAQLHSEFGVNAAHDLSLASGADVVLLAVKPQQLREVCQQLSAHVTPSTLIISIAAGIRLQDIQRWLGGHSKLVRVMPNTPALVGAGVSGIFAADAVDEQGRQQAATILNAVGSVVWLDNEDQIDSVTAVSGSGPAYVFYFIEALQAAAEAQGFKPEAARQLALETFAGSLKLALNSAEDVAVLRARVTSKGGTTERAIKTMDEQEIKASIALAVAGAAERSREMAEELGKQG